MSRETSDVVVVGGGTVGGWCAAFLKQAGAGRVILIDKGRLGMGASSRAAGMVRAQGGTPVAVDLGMWSIAFYNRQKEEFGLDSGFVEQGYFMPAFDSLGEQEGKKRVAMQQALGLEVEWLGSDEAEKLNPTLAKGICLGGSYAPGDGYIDPPRNVLSYATALARAGVEVKEGVGFSGLEISADKVTGIRTTEGIIETERVVLTGGPELASVGRLAGTSIPAGGVRHQVAITEPCLDLDPRSHPMVFDVGEGLYWRPEEGGSLLFGMSNPQEAPGIAKGVDWDYLKLIRTRLAHLVPGTKDLEIKKIWAATIDFTPDHLPIFGRCGAYGVTVASAGGHGMMWGPGVAKVAADVCLTGTTEITDISDFGLDRFDAEGKSRLAPDPIALPFPERTN